MRNFYQFFSQNSSYLSRDGLRQSEKKVEKMVETRRMAWDEKSIETRNREIAFYNHLKRSHLSDLHCLKNKFPDVDFSAIGF